LTQNGEEIHSWLFLVRIERLTRVLSFGGDHNAINMGIAAKMQLSAEGFVLRQK
jgi:hypothetical protein